MNILFFIGILGEMMLVEISAIEYWKVTNLANFRIMSAWILVLTYNILYIDECRKRKVR